TKIVIDGKPGKAADLPKGVVVTVQLAAPGDKAAAVVRTEGPTIGGLVKAVDAKAGTITFTTRRGRGAEDVEDRTLKVSAGAIINIDGKEGKLPDVRTKAPAALKLSFNEKSVVAIAQGRGRERGGERGPRVIEVGGTVESATA